jgi:hypothetical protein
MPAKSDVAPIVAEILREQVAASRGSVASPSLVDSRGSTHPSGVSSWSSSARSGTPTACVSGSSSAPARRSTFFEVAASPVAGTTNVMSPPCMEASRSGHRSSSDRRPSVSSRIATTAFTALLQVASVPPLRSRDAARALQVEPLVNRVIRTREANSRGEIRQTPTPRWDSVPPSRFPVLLLCCVREIRRSTSADHES